MGGENVPLVTLFPRNKNWTCHIHYQCQGMTAFDWGSKINQQSILFISNMFHISLTKYTLQGTKKFPSDEIMIEV